MSWRRDWWPANRVVVISSVVIVAVLVVLWIALYVPMVPRTHGYAVEVVTADNWIHLPEQASTPTIVSALSAPPGWGCTSFSVNISFIPNDVASAFVPVPPFTSGSSTVLGSYWAPNGTSMAIYVSFGGTLCLSNHTSGSFDFSANQPVDGAGFTVVSAMPVTVYVNGTYSYLGPLL